MFDVQGKQLSAMELRPGMKLTATRIVEEPVVYNGSRAATVPVAALPMCRHGRARRMR